MIMLGISPESYRVALFPGTVENGVFSQSLWHPTVAMGAPKDGYLVSKVKAGSTIAVTVVRHSPDPDAIFKGTNFVPCKGAKTMVFKVPRGKVAYLGSVTYRFAGDKLNIHSDNDLEGAKAYVAAHFPAMKDKVEFTAPDYLPTTASCNLIIAVPYYTSGRR